MIGSIDSALGKNNNKTPTKIFILLSKNHNIPGVKKEKGKCE